MYANLMLLLIAFVLSFTLTGFFSRYAVNFNLLDVPNARSSHVIPTPRGGGVVFACIFLIMTCLFVQPLTEMKTKLIGFVCAASLIASIGFLDDIRDLSTKIRFLIQCIAVLILMLCTNSYGYLDIGLTNYIPIWILAPISLIGFVWLVNLYNFMDGIDGFAASQGITTCGTLLALLLLFHPDEYLLILSGLMIACLSGFIVWNWSPAKIFMGDVGSGFLGLFFAYMILASPFSLWTWMVLLSGFWVDATATLIRRVASGQHWTTPHKTHAYQQLTKRWGRHNKVTLSLIVLNVFWNCPLAFATVRWPNMAPWITLFAIVPIFGLVLLLNAGKIDEDTQ